MMLNSVYNLKLTLSRNLSLRPGKPQAATGSYSSGLGLTGRVELGGHPGHMQSEAGTKTVPVNPVPHRRRRSVNAP